MILYKLLESIFSAILSESISNGFKFRQQIRKRIVYNVFQRNKDIRVSMAALLILRINNHYILLRNTNRTELFGPIGGAYKYNAAGEGFLNKMGFIPQAPGSPDDSKMRHDLRGIIKAKYLFTFLKWFLSKEGREADCINREFYEELKSIHLDHILTQLEEPPTYQFVRRVSEGPFPIYNKNYSQFRIFDIFELDSNYPHKSKLLSKLKGSMKSTEDLLLVTADEIKHLRTDKHARIGSHSSYLLGKEKFGPDETAF